MADYKGWDSPEDIQKCLNCRRSKCTNCLSAHDTDRVKQNYHKRRAALLASGVEVPSLVQKRAIMERCAKVKELCAQGFSDEEIGKKLGMSTSTARRYRVEQGIPNYRERVCAHA